MRFETFQFILNNKHKMLYDDAAATGNDTTTDATAAMVNPNSLLAPLANGRALKGFLVLVLLVLAILFLIKKML